MRSALLVAAIAALAFTGPAAAKPGHGHENGHLSLHVGHGHRYGLFNRHEGRRYAYGLQGPVGYGVGGCPPGLAKKGCMPPGQAKKLLRGPRGPGMR